MCLAERARETDRESERDREKGREKEKICVWHREKGSMRDR